MPAKLATLDLFEIKVFRSSHTSSTLFLTSMKIMELCILAILMFKVTKIFQEEIL